MRLREYVPGLFGKASAWRWAMQRSSNSYSFNDPASSKSDFQTRTPTQGSTNFLAGEKIHQSIDSKQRAARSRHAREIRGEK
jgi:hypothetical protein